MLCLTCTMISSVNLAHYGESPAKDWVFVDCGTSPRIILLFISTSTGFYIRDCLLTWQRIPSICLTRTNLSLTCSSQAGREIPESYEVCRFI